LPKVLKNRDPWQDSHQVRAGAGFALGSVLQAPPQFWAQLKPVNLRANPRENLTPD
jgi:hypothetical protein